MCFDLIQTQQKIILPDLNKYINTIPAYFHRKSLPKNESLILWW